MKLTLLQKEALDAVEAEYNRLTNQARSESVRTNLQRIHTACRSIVVEGRQPVGVAIVARYLLARFPGDCVSEQTIRNNRPGGNPYKELISVWQAAVDRFVTATRPPWLPTSGVLSESDITRIGDIQLQHQVRLLFVRARNQQRQLEMLQRIDSKPLLPNPKRLELEAEDGGSKRILARDLILTDLEVDALREFLTERQMKKNRLVRTPEGAVQTSEGKMIADPGFCMALEKVIRSHST